MSKFAVIDTETNWNNEVMSIGVVIDDDERFDKSPANNAVIPLDRKYYIITPECEVGGMYGYALNNVPKEFTIKCSREQVIKDLLYWLNCNQIKAVFAYNASFDCRCLPELNMFEWYDIMRLAAYKQFNHKIADELACCSTGRLQRGYGVEPILKMLMDNEYFTKTYSESHNALLDAQDELKIMYLLGYKVKDYIKLN